MSLWQQLHGNFFTVTAKAHSGLREGRRESRISQETCRNRHPDCSFRGLKPASLILISSAPPPGRAYPAGCAFSSFP